MKQECVVSFKSENRRISMYFTEENGDLDMQMTMDPELKDGEEPDLPLLLAGAFMTALNIDKNENESQIITSD